MEEVLCLLSNNTVSRLLDDPNRPNLPCNDPMEKGYKAVEVRAIGDRVKRARGWNN